MAQLKVPLLEDLLEYGNEKVIASFLKSFLMSPDEAREVFRETMKWVWLCHTHNLEVAGKKRGGAVPEEIYIFPSTQILDEMWHQFILCTEEYFDFCSRYFGQYLHHTPNTEAADAKPSNAGSWRIGTSTTLGRFIRSGDGHENRKNRAS